MIKETCSRPHSTNTINKQALEQSHQPTTTINHSSLFWENITSTQSAPNPHVKDVERDKQKSTGNILFGCSFWGPHLPVCPWDESKTPQDSRQVTEQVCSQWDCCLRSGKRMKCILATAGAHQRVIKQVSKQFLSSAFTTAPNTTY